MILDANQNGVWKEPCAAHGAPPTRCLIQLLLAHVGCPPAVSWSAPNTSCNSNWARTAPVTSHVYLVRWANDSVVAYSFLFFIHLLIYFEAVMSAPWLGTVFGELARQCCWTQPFEQANLFLRLHHQEGSFPPPWRSSLKARSNLSLHFLPLHLLLFCLSFWDLLAQGSLSWQLPAGLCAPLRTLHSSP